MNKYTNEMIKHPQFYYKPQLYLSIIPIRTWLTSRSTLITQQTMQQTTYLDNNNDSNHSRY